MNDNLKLSPRHQVGIAAAALAALGALYGTLHSFGNRLPGGDWRPLVVETIAIGLAAGVVYLVALYGLQLAPDHRWTLWLLLAGALIFRLQLFPLAPAISDDLYRYRWEGRVQSAGYDPYTIRPDDPRLQHLRQEGFERIPGRDVPSIYPPLVELSYRATCALAPDVPGNAPLVLTKLPYLAADLLLLGLLAGWIRSTGGRAWLVAVYAWNPLVIVEFAASGHNDAMATAAVVAAAMLVARGRGTASTVLLSAATMLKWFPVVLFPVWLRRQGWPLKKWSWINLGAAAAFAMACAWPYRSAWPGVLDAFAYYEAHWQMNNASLYALLVWFSGSRDLAAGAGVGIVAGLALWTAWRRLDVLRGAFLLFGAILLLSPNANSWYFTWIIPLLCFFPNPAWLLLSVLQFLSYHVLLDYHATGKWEFQPFYLWLTYGPFYALLLWQLLRPNRIGNWKNGAV